MQQTPRFVALLIVALVLVVFPALYIGSYLALVNRGQDFGTFQHVDGQVFTFKRYRIGGTFAKRVFWPLEQIDRKLQPGNWDTYEHGGVI